MNRRRKIGLWFCRRGFHKTTRVTSIDETPNNMTVMRGRYCIRCKLLIVDTLEQVRGVVRR